MDKPSSCFLPERIEEIPIDGCEMKCGPGKCAVLMAGVRKESHGLLLPSTVQGRLRPDYGAFIDGRGAKSQRDGSEEILPLKRGDLVLVRPYDGAWMDDYHNGHQLRFYGLARNEAGEMEHVAWDDSILCVHRGGKWVPVGGNLQIKRDKETNPLIPDEVKKYLDSGVVVAVGDYVSEEYVGTRVHLTPTSQEDLIEMEFTDGERDLFIAHQSIISLVADLVA